MTTIRRIESSEWRTLREVRLRALKDAPYAFGSTFEEEARRPDDWWMSSVVQSDESAGLHIVWFVAEQDGQFVGLTAGMPPSGDRSCPEVISMWVAAERRGTGLATRLLEAVIRWAEDEGAQALCLGVAEGNERARRFYERTGFTPTGRSEPLRSNPKVRIWEMELDLIGAQ